MMMRFYNVTLWILIVMIVVVSFFILMVKLNNPYAVKEFYECARYIPGGSCV